jgi:hypothetical protein
VRFEADQAAQVLPNPGVVVVVVPIVAVHGAQVPWGKVVVEGVPVVSARRVHASRPPGGAWAPASRRPSRTGMDPPPGRCLTRNTRTGALKISP